MKISKQGLEEIRMTIETPFQTLAKQLDENGCLDKQTAEIVTFIFSKFNQLGDESWEIID